jgi:tetratricopeptide (TPR) repeat protein
LGGYAYGGGGVAAVSAKQKEAQPALPSECTLSAWAGYAEGLVDAPFVLELALISQPCAALLLVLAQKLMAGGQHGRCNELCRRLIAQRPAVPSLLPTAHLVVGIVQAEQNEYESALGHGVHALELCLADWGAEGKQCFFLEHAATFVVHLLAPHGPKVLNLTIDGYQMSKAIQKPQLPLSLPAETAQSVACVAFSRILAMTTTHSGFSDNEYLIRCIATEAMRQYKMATHANHIAALTCLQVGSILAPMDGQIRFNLGVMAAEAGLMPLAIAKYEQAEQLGDAGASYNLGVLLAEQEREDEALLRYRRAIQHDPAMVRAF